MSFARLVLVCSLLWPVVSLAKGARAAPSEITVEEALDSAEKRLDSGGDGSDIAARLRKTKGLTRPEVRRLELIEARSALLAGQYAVSEKALGRFHVATPDDARISEWYARALDGAGKGEAAMPLLKQLAEKDQLRDGDSYWVLAQLERQGGDHKTALVHARAALTHPIVLQSDELDRAIHKFIGELSGGKDK